MNQFYTKLTIKNRIDKWTNGWTFEDFSIMNRLDDSIKYWNTSKLKENNGEKKVKYSCHLLVIYSWGQKEHIKAFKT